MFDISIINKSHQLTKDQYYQDDCSLLKKEIVIHHTAGGSSGQNTIGGWQSNSDHVATAFVISGRPGKNEAHKDGEICLAFDEKNWAYHLAFSKSTNNVPSKYHNFTHETEIAKATIGIEICSWGPLTKQADGTFKNYVGGVVPSNEVETLATAFRGSIYYHKYSDAQIASLKELIVYLCDKYNIPKTYNEDMWDISTKALDGTPGIWTHVSFRSDKSDCVPQVNLVATLKSLNIKNI